MLYLCIFGIMLLQHQNHRVVPSRIGRRPDRLKTSKNSSGDAETSQNKPVNFARATSQVKETVVICFLGLLLSVCTNCQLFGDVRSSRPTFSSLFISNELSFGPREYKGKHRNNRIFYVPVEF